MSAPLILDTQGYLAKAVVTQIQALSCNARPALHSMLLTIQFFSGTIHLHLYISIIVCVTLCFLSCLPNLYSFSPVWFPWPTSLCPVLFLTHLTTHLLRYCGWPTDLPGCTFYLGINWPQPITGGQGGSTDKYVSIIRCYAG